MLVQVLSEEKEEEEVMEMGSDCWNTVMRRRRDCGGKKEAGVGAREANSTPGPCKGSAGRGGRRPVVTPT